MTTQLPEMDPFENPVIEFDFSDEFDAVDTAVVTVVTTAGRDVNPVAFLVGALQIVGALVKQRVNVGIHGVDYKLRCEGVRGANKRVRTGVVPVRRA